MFVVLNILISLISSTNSCPPLPLSASPTNQISQVLSFAADTPLNDPTRSHNLNFFETHLARLHKEIAEYQAKVNLRAGKSEVGAHWIATQNKTILRLKQMEQRRLQDLYEKYKRGELPSVGGVPLNDMVGLKTLVGDEVIHMGLVPVESISKDGVKTISYAYNPGPERRQVEEFMRDTEEGLGDLATLLIPQGRSFSKTSRIDGANIRKIIAPALQLVLQNAPLSDDELEAWREHLPEDQRFALAKDLRNMSSKNARMHQMRAWFFAQNPGLLKSLSLEADSQRVLRSREENDAALDVFSFKFSATLLAVSVLPEEQRASDLKIINSFVADDEIKIDPEKVAKLSAPLRYFIALSQALEDKNELKNSRRSREMSRAFSRASAMREAQEEGLSIEEAMTRLILDKKLSAAVVTINKYSKNPLNLESSAEESEKLPETATSSITNFSFGDKEKALPKGIAKGSPAALAFSGYYDEPAVALRLSDAGKGAKAVNFSEFRKKLKLSNVDIAPSDFGADLSAKYTAPQLQGRADKNPSYACQTYAVVADFESTLNLDKSYIDRRSLSIPYAYGLVSAQGELGKIPDRLYSAMMKVAQKNVGFLLPGEVATASDRGGSVGGVLRALSENYSVAEYDAPENSKGEAFFPESISEFSKKIAEGDEEGHERFKIRDFSFVESRNGVGNKDVANLILQMLANQSGPIVSTSTDGRTIVENWFRPIPGETGHVLNIVGFDPKAVSAFDAKPKPAFIVRDSFAPEGIHYYVSAAELLPFITGVGKITSATKDTGFLR